MTMRLSPETLTLRQLRNKAVQLEISRYSRMTKEQLLEAIREAELDRLNQGSSGRSGRLAVAAKYQLMSTGDESSLAVDTDLGELPEGYGDSRIVLLPRDPHWAYAYWDIPNEHKEQLRQQGGAQLALRLYEALGEWEDLNETLGRETQAHAMKEYPCDELAREWYLPVPSSDRSYFVEIGYNTETGEWLPLARSARVMIPPTYPSDWLDEHFITVPFDLSLHGKTLYQLWEPPRSAGRSLGLVTYQGTEIQYPAVQPGGFPQSSLKPWGASGSGLGLGVQPSSGVEVVIQGKAPPESKILLHGDPLDLGPDGSFEFKISLPEGDQTVPLQITSPNYPYALELSFTPPSESRAEASDEAGSY